MYKKIIFITELITDLTSYLHLSVNFIEKQSHKIVASKYKENYSNMIIVCRNKMARYVLH